MGRAIDLFVTYRFLRLLTTPFEDTQAYKLGIIDANGNRIMQKRIKKPVVELVTSEQKNSYTILHKLVFNIKKLLGKIPGGKSVMASYAVALLLLKEEYDLDEEQTELLYEDFYKHAKSLNKIDAEVITEAMEVGKLCTGKINGGCNFNLRQQLKQNWDEHGDFKVYPAKTQIQDVGEYASVYGIKIYEGKIEQDRVLFTAEDVY